MSENLIQIASPVFDWFGGFCRHFTYAQLATDGQTNRQTSSTLKAPYPLGAGLNDKLLLGGGYAKLIVDLNNSAYR